MAAAFTFLNHGSTCIAETCSSFTPGLSVRQRRSNSAISSARHYPLGSLVLESGDYGSSSAVSYLSRLHFKMKYRTRASICWRFPDGASALRTRPCLVLIQHGLRRCRGQNLRRQQSWCMGASAAGVMAIQSVVDQVLLLGTVFGVYIAGVATLPRIIQSTPDRKAPSGRQDPLPSYKSEKRKPIRDQNPPDSPQYHGEDSWLQLRAKLVQAISKEASETEEEVVKYPRLGLQAVSRVPKFHLLLAALHHLRKEVTGISDEERFLDPKQWQERSLNVLSCSVEPVCRDWLSQEFPQIQTPADVLDSEVASAGTKEEHFSLDAAFDAEVNSQRGMGETSNSVEQIVLDSMMAILKESESLPSYIARSGKSNLYADLIFFLRFGSVRSQGCCDHRVFRKHRGNILEDMVVTVAEVVATLFLDCCSNASLSPCGETWQTILLPYILSSRSLERFRNEVALAGWMNQNFSSVAAMFEDRFELWAVKRLPIPTQGRKQDKASTKKPAKMMVVQPTDVVLTLTEVPARRSGELKALTGWRYYYSLFLEFSDVVGPLLRILASKLGDVLSFLLTILIGRSMGLVYQGIRQSIRWPTNQKLGKS